MKTSITYLGIVLTLFFNVVSAKGVALEQQIIENEVVKTELNSNLDLISNSKFEKPEVTIESEERIRESIASITSNYVKSIEEIIVENKKIIESPEEEYYPLNFGLSIEELIQLNNQIIENEINDEVYPLDFDLINHSKFVENNFEFKNDEAIKS